MNNTSTANSTRKPVLRAAGLAAQLPILAALIAAIAPQAWAGTTDISNQPLATLPTVQAKPNLLFILDNSGSMGSEYMPDDMSDNTTYGYWSVQCNGVAYDPTQTYSPPLTSTGGSYAHSSFAAAWNDGYKQSSGTTNLGTASNGYNIYYTHPSATPAAMSWVYTASGVTSNTFYNECTSTVGNSPGKTAFTAHTMTSGSADAQNYADWYSYYRKRYLMMRTAMGRAIATLDSSYNVGFSTISDKTATDGTNNFRDVKPFAQSQKDNFYSSLYAASPSGNTPLRGALSKAGQYFADKASGQTYDPMQYSCQRNYALLSTDGYWNTGLESTSTPKYGPYKLDNSTNVGNQDAPPEVRPMKDATTATTVTTTTVFTAPATSKSVSNVSTRNNVWTRKTVTLGPVGTVGGGSHTTGSCVRTGYHLVTTKTQTAPEQQTEVFTTPQTGTSTYTETVVVVNSVTTSDTSSTPTQTWTQGATTVAITDTSNPSPTNTTPVDPPAANPPAYNYNAGTSVVTACDNTTVASGPTDTLTTTGTFTTPTYSTQNVVIGTYTAGTPGTATAYTGGASNTLADIAEYYYKTDLRDASLNNCTSTSSGSSQNVCANLVRPTSTDLETTQHMNTFTIGLGVSGTLPYDKNYLTSGTGSYAALTAGTLDWPTPTQSSQGGDATDVDDLWHAAVNGRGQYYSALNASLLAEAINGVVSTVQQVAGSGSSASTSSLQLVAGDNNQIFKASYTTGSWTGDLQAYSVAGATATIAATPNWSAQALLDAKTVTSRKIYFSNGAATPVLKTFVYTNLSTAQKAYFDNLCSQAVVATQCATLSTTDKATANTGANLVNYIGGVRSYESAVATATGGLTVTAAPLYRKRDHVLGDVIDGAPVYVGKPPLSYADAGYADFVTAQTARAPMVYVAANDGMLHAFSAALTGGGAEQWAYVPSFVMPNLYKLADSNYGNAHQYYVDGAPNVGDIKVGSTWKTILVGGLQYGGKGYYALDVTDPANPVPLWEFTDANMGYTFGNPIITKRADGTWVVVISSGYNNTTGDGAGHLYVLNAATGAKLLDISTGAGSATSPSGLSKINAWVETDTDNTATRFYGGDLLGNLWRFDVDNLVLPNHAAQQIALFQINATSPQPITTKPVAAELSGKAVVIVATGRYLGSSDITDTTQQSIYAVKDNLTNSGWGDVRNGTFKTAFVQQTFTLSGSGATAVAAVSDTTVDLTSTTIGGWYVDLPHSGERVATDMSLQFDTLLIATAIPNGDACASGGASWRYFLDVTNGGVITTNPAGMLWSDHSLIVGAAWVKDSSGNVHIIYQNSDGSVTAEVPPGPPPGTPGNPHRTSWRELAN